MPSRGTAEGEQNGESSRSGIDIDTSSLCQDRRQGIVFFCTCTFIHAVVPAHSKLAAVIESVLEEQPKNGGASTGHVIVPVTGLLAGTCLLAPWRLR